MNLPQVSTRLQKVRSFPWHGLLFSLYPIFFLYDQNKQELVLSELGIPILIAVTASAVLFLIFYLATRMAWKAGLAVTLFFLVFFSFGHLRELFFDQAVTSTRLTVAIGLLLMLAGAIFLVWRSRSEGGALTRFLNLVSLALVLFALGSIALYQRANMVTIERGQLASTGDRNITDKPDVYYLIFDRYANQHTLQDMYGFDNTSFIEELEKRDFYVADQSIGNYPNTLHSLTSSLNLDYLQSFTGDLPAEATSVTPLEELLKKNAVVETLKAQGYTYYHMGSWWDPTKTNPAADRNFVASATPFYLSEFATKLFFNDSILEPLSGRLLPKTDVSHHDRGIYTLDQLKKIADRPSNGAPKFIFAHVLLPHEPYQFDAECKFIEVSLPERKADELPYYLDQVRCANRLIPEVLDAITSRSAKPPVIIVQSDEGPHPILHARESGGLLSAPSDLTLQEKFRILNAYHLPGFDTAQLYPGISPVNTFRLVFNHYFGTEYSKLPDKSYTYETFDYPYDLHDVTERVRFSNP